MRRGIKCPPCMEDGCGQLSTVKLESQPTDHTAARTAPVNAPGAAIASDNCLAARGAVFLRSLSNGAIAQSAAVRCAAAMPAHGSGGRTPDPPRAEASAATIRVPVTPTTWARDRGHDAAAQRQSKANQQHAHHRRFHLQPLSCSVVASHPARLPKPCFSRGDGN
jgi:hypothetical protein